LTGGASEQVAGVEETSSPLDEMSSMFCRMLPHKAPASATEKMDAQAKHLDVFIGDLVAFVNGSANGRRKRHQNPAFKAKLEPISKTI
jgi:hypothetical protein